MLVPTGSAPYYRLPWTEPDDRPGRTSAGRTEEASRAKAEETNAMLDRAAGASGAMTLCDITAVDLLLRPLEQTVVAPVAQKDGVRAQLADCVQLGAGHAAATGCAVAMTGMLISLPPPPGPATALARG